MKKPETLIQDKVVDYLNERRILHWRMSGATNLAGFPDLLLCYKGHFVALEIKTDDGAPTEQQLKVIKDINKNGGFGLIVKSVEDVEVALKMIWEGFKLDY